jgi:hypothetical protein
LTVSGPTTVEVGQGIVLNSDAVQAAHSSCEWQLLVGDWTSGDDAIATVDVDPRPLTERASVVGRSPGTAEITVIVRGLTAKATITVTEPALPSGIAYGFVDLTGTPNNAYAFNSLGDNLTATRTATGRYRVTIPGFTGGSEESRIAFANAVNGENAVCLATTWTMKAVAHGGDATVDVACSTAAGVDIDSDFVIFAVGQWGLSGDYAFAYSRVLAGLADGFQLVLPWRESAWSTHGGVLLGRLITNPIGRFYLRTNLPGAPPVAYAVIQSPAGAVHSRCTFLSFGRDNEITCRPPGGEGYSPDPFSIMLLSAGRAGMRMGSVWASSPSSSNYSGSVLARRNSAGGEITISRTDVGTYQVVFAGLGRAEQTRREIVMVSTQEQSSAVSCRISEPWSTAVAANLTVQVGCVNGAGTASDAAFFVVVLE